MSQGRIEITKLLSSTPIFSIYYWVSLLNVFDQYRDEVDIDDVRRLVAECERCRTEFNKKNPTDPIRTQDTNPNVYVRLEQLESKEIYKEENLPANELVVAVA